jgi:threonine dehydratase
MGGMDVRFADVVAARAVVAGYLPATPAWSYPVLDAEVGATVVVKHENVQPTGAFKVRGGLTLLAGLAAEERARGLVTYSTGNHAQSIAYACAAYGVPCTVVMPAGASAGKVRAVRALGATVELHGEDMAVAQQRAEEVAARPGAGRPLLVSPGDTAALVAGVGTLYLELFERYPDLDAVLVPVGSGTGVAAACLVAAEVAPRCRVVGVQSAASPAAHDSWRTGACVSRPDRTVVAGLATGRGFDLPQRLMRDRLAGFHLVDDAAIGAAQALLATHAHTLAEGAGAAALAGVLAAPADYAGRRVAVICTGGNAPTTELAALAARATPDATAPAAAGATGLGA